MKISLQSIKNKKNIIVVASLAVIAIMLVFLVLAISKKPESKVGTRSPKIEVEKSAFDSLSQPKDAGEKSRSREIIDLLPAPNMGNVKANPDNPEDKTSSREIIDLLPSPVK